MTKHAEDLAKLGWQYFECPACGSEGARAFPKPEQLAQQEPVAYIRVSKTGHVMACAKTGDFYKLPDKTLLYTSPPAQRTWVGLTDEEVTKMPAWIYSPDQDGMTAEEGLETFARAIEAKLREKNQ